MDAGPSQPPNGNRLSVNKCKGRLVVERMDSIKNLFGCELRIVDGDDDGGGCDGGSGSGKDGGAAGQSRATTTFVISRLDDYKPLDDQLVERLKVNANVDANTPSQSRVSVSRVWRPFVGFPQPPTARKRYRSCNARIRPKPRAVTTARPSVERSSDFSRFRHTVVDTSVVELRNARCDGRSEWRIVAAARRLLCSLIFVSNTHRRKGSIPNTIRIPLVAST